ncbi:MULTISPECIES: DUF397 domain-containing protein [Actinomadura]|uniref:DUF397 domain-containing protein n=1 Tax=Actinomadura yumaensis TaxID=111807 RepID=A0ABW2CC01_9ACTN|nr:DUF397 domain-containing protein [Actinomadura sp. J1-007]MWK38093.1 DUF397 domain-containing protein [Actinomadura sp. J1-007]
MTSIVWRKSSHSGVQQGDCVELADLGNVIAVRDSKDPEGGVLRVGREEFGELVRVLRV